METVSDLLQKATSALKALDGTTLTPDKLASTVNLLEGVNIQELLEKFQLPAETENEDVAARNKVRDLANGLNKSADVFNDELDRIKRMRSTLNLEALDPVIHAAKKLIQPVFGFTADLQQYED